MKNNEIKCPHCGSAFTVNESEYATLLEQIKAKEIEKAVDEKVKLLNEKASKDSEIAVLNAVSEKTKELADKIAENEKLHILLDNAKKEAENKLALAMAEKEKSLAEMKAKLDAEKAKAKTEKAQLIERHKDELKHKDEQIAFHKDFKMRLSTKMIGESLEQHCENEFNKIRMTAFPNAQFIKDNDAKSGGKGDYIYREYTPEGVEILSIMFDMKNEGDETSTKHKNVDFLDKLDKDRKTKNCEYAVLVSMLEQDSEYYNAGIVDVSYVHDKTYVVRPQQFIQIISLLRSMAMKSLEYKKQIVAMQNQEIDIVNFETKLLEFKDSFAKSVSNAGNNFKKGVDWIDKAIDSLTKAKEAILLTEKQLNAANNKADDLSIKKLIKGNATLTEMYKSAYKEAEVVGEAKSPDHITSGETAPEKPELPSFLKRKTEITEQ